uniref:Uncharacterized protein n=1 Tax=viral metagenome TaxID=1070528 RepID=A0A6C0LNK3_9ZZZZ
MNYSTLQEAYNVDTFEKKPRPSQKQKNNNGNGNNAMNSNGSNANSNNGSANTNANTSPSFVESSKLAMSSCSPLQAPTYNIPISNDCKKDHAEAMSVYLEANDKQSSSPSPTEHSSAMASMFNLKNSGSSGNGDNNVMPYYDEDLEQYFNISNLNDEVKYNSNSNTNINTYMPNSNKQSYTNNDTAEYTNNNTMIKHGNNLLNNTSYNLTPEEKKSAEEAIAYLKSIEEKINKNATADPVVSNANTGPGGYKTPSPQQPPLPQPTPVATVATPQEKSEKSGFSDNYIYNAIFNIAILLIIGIAIILLCDQMVELAIQIGMKRAVYILEPYIKAP